MENKITKPFTELNAGGKTYLLRLTALSAVRLEERLGMSVYKAIEHTDEVRTVTEILYALIESLRPEFVKNDVYGVYDDFISGGGTLNELNGIIAEALGNSGFFGQASQEQRSF